MTRKKLTRRTAAEALEDVTSSAEARKAKPAPKGKRRKPAAKAKPASMIPPAEAGQRYTVTTVRLTPDQAAWLRRTALERAIEAGVGKPDASEVLRALVDAAMEADG